MEALQDFKPNYNFLLRFAFFFLHGCSHYNLNVKPSDCSVMSTALKWRQRRIFDFMQMGVTHVSILVLLWLNCVCPGMDWWLVQGAFPTLGPPRHHVVKSGWDNGWMVEWMTWSCNATWSKKSEWHKVNQHFVWGLYGGRRQQPVLWLLIFGFTSAHDFMQSAGESLLRLMTENLDFRLLLSDLKVLVGM